MAYLNTTLQKGRFIIDAVVFNEESIESNTIQQCIDEHDFKREGVSTVKALIDTGATHCCITEELASILGLEVCGKQTVNTAGHPVECAVYQIVLGIPVSETYSHKNKEIKETEHIPTLETHNFIGVPQQVFTLPKQNKGRGFDIILGMNFLDNMIFHYTGSPNRSGGGLLTIGF